MQEARKDDYDEFNKMEDVDEEGSDERLENKEVREELSTSTSRIELVELLDYDEGP